MQFVNLIERYRFAICITLLLVSWASPWFSIGMQIAAFVLCIAIMVPAIIISVDGRNASKAHLPVPASYYVLLVAALGTMGIAIAFQFILKSELDTGGMIFPVSAMISLIASSRASGISRRSDA